MSCIHKKFDLIYISLVVSYISSGAGVSALLHELGVALLLQGLPGHLLLHVGALLPGGGGALPGRHGGALLVILVLGHGDRHVAADLLGDLIADLAGSAHVITDLEMNRLQHSVRTLIVKSLVVLPA